MEQKVFRPECKTYKMIAGKRFRLPRKAKKRYKTYMCKHMDFKKLKLSYKLFNIDVEG